MEEKHGAAAKTNDKTTISTSGTSARAGGGYPSSKKKKKNKSKKKKGKGGVSGVTVTAASLLESQPEQLPETPWSPNLRQQQQQQKQEQQPSLHAAKPPSSHLAPSSEGAISTQANHAPHEDLVKSTSTNNDVDEDCDVVSAVFSSSKCPKGDTNTDTTASCVVPFECSWAEIGGNTTLDTLAPAATEKGPDSKVRVSENPSSRSPVPFPEPAALDPGSREEIISRDNQGR